MEGFLFTLLIGGAAIALLARWRRIRVWRTIARDAGLEFGKPSLFAGPRISGELDDMFVDVRLIDQNKTRFVQVMIEYRPAPTEFSITRATQLGTSITRSDTDAVFESVTGKDIEIGQAEFDELATIHGSAPALKAYVTPERRRAMRYLLETFPGARITQSELRVRSKAGLHEHARLSSMLEEALRAARTIRPSRSTPAAQPAPEPAPPSDPPSPHRPAPTGARSTNARLMADELFGESGFSYEVDRRFHNHYAGQLVRWSGHLVDTQADRSVVEATKLLTQGGTTLPVLIVTDNPAPAGLRVGDWVTVDGIVSDIDHLEHAVYVQDAVTYRTES